MEKNQIIISEFHKNAFFVNLGCFSLLRFILIGCDGLWKSFSVQESVKFIEQLLNVSCPLSLCPVLKKCVMSLVFIIASSKMGIVCSCY